MIAWSLALTSSVPVAVTCVAGPAIFASIVLSIVLTETAPAPAATMPDS
jgi:hypothetical protein